MSQEKAHMRASAHSAIEHALTSEPHQIQDLHQHIQNYQFALQQSHARAAAFEVAAQQAHVRAESARQEIRTTQTRLARSEAEAAKLQSAFEREQKTSQQLTEKLAAKEQIAAELQAYGQNLEHALHAAQQHAEAVTEQLRQLHASRSWRLTQPLRRAEATAHAFRHGVKKYFTPEPHNWRHRLLTSFRQWLSAHPRWNSAVVRWLNHHPDIKRRIVQAQISATSHDAPAPAISQQPDASAWTAIICKRLQNQKFASGGN
ncbi:MAG: hypothetical protein Q4G70_00540 [Pseudomonadota bacterium]|nr:hypothetical protein [Pseudomonadota bacterium]